MRLKEGFVTAAVTSTALRPLVPPTHPHAITHTEGFYQSITFLFHRFKAPVKLGLYQQPTAYLCNLALSGVAADLQVE